MRKSEGGGSIAEELVAIVEPSVELPEEDLRIVAAHTELGNTLPLVALSTSHIPVQE